VVQRRGESVRVNAQVIDARNDAHLWAQTYDRDLADVFAIQKRASPRAIADQLQAKLSPNERKSEQARTRLTGGFRPLQPGEVTSLTAGFKSAADPDRRGN